MGKNVTSSKRKTATWRLLSICKVIKPITWEEKRKSNVKIYRKFAKTQKKFENSRLSWYCSQRFGL